MARIDALETRYAGYRMRSRTEGRWAALFDCLAIRYEYEPEGYRLGSGCYLPDFWLPELRLYLEVKGKEPTAEECRKCAELVEGLGIDALLVVGPPRSRFQIHWFDRGGQREDLYALAQDRFAECGFWLVAEDHSNWIGPAKTAQLPGGPMFSGALEEAVAVASSARFEPEWRNKPYPPIPHEPHRLAAVWCADDEDQAA